MATQKKSGPPTKGIEVLTRKEGLRRGGREWSGAMTVALSDLTPEQLDSIRSEPLFSVRDVDIAPGAEGAAT